MRALCPMLRQIAASEASLLISGESGTGEEVVARAIHRQGRTAISTFAPCGPCVRLLDEVWRRQQSVSDALHELVRVERLEQDVTGAG